MAFFFFLKPGDYQLDPVSSGYNGLQQIQEVKESSQINQASASCSHCAASVELIQYDTQIFKLGSFETVPIVLKRLEYSE